MERFILVRGVKFQGTVIQDLEIEVCTGFCASVPNAKKKAYTAHEIAHDCWVLVETFQSPIKEDQHFLSDINRW